LYIQAALTVAGENKSLVAKCTSVTPKPGEDHYAFLTTLTLEVTRERLDGGHLQLSLWLAHNSLRKSDEIFGQCAVDDLRNIQSAPVGPPKWQAVF